jgi:asparagine synthase (glutamine-hydrolysing)
MPGIVGIIAKARRAESEVQLNRMVEAMRHEAFYETGTWIDEPNGIYVGWVSREGSVPTGPLVSKNGQGSTLIFSGEDFSRFGESEATTPNGHGKLPRGEYLVDLADGDPAFPACLNGRFQGLVARGSRREAILFNDRYGLSRIYYYEGKDAFYFAAEAKSLLAVRPELREIDSRSLGELVSCGCVLENRSVFRNIGVLPPGSGWIFANKALVAKKTYFDPKIWENQEPLESEAYYRELRECFSSIVPRYFGGYKSIGMSLTGGLDSRMIMAWQRAQPRTFTCFSFGGPFRDCEDVIIARKVAETCSQHHETIRVADEFLLGFPRYAERSIFLTDACVDVSRTPDLYINQQTRQVTPTRMTGNYGGEVLRSIRAFKPVEPPAGLFHSDFTPHLEAAKTTYKQLVDVRPLTFSLFRQAPWHHYGLLSLEQTQLAVRTPFLDNELVRIVFRAPKKTLTNNDISLRLIADGNRALRRLRTDRGLAGNTNKWFSAARHEFLEFTFKAEYAYDYGMPQWVAKVDHTFSGLHLERMFLGRHKFYHFRVWYRDALAGYVREMLLDPRTLGRSYLQRAMVEQIVAGHLKGDSNYTTAIHKILTLEHLHRLFIDAR